jgi:hypothetical protein
VRVFLARAARVTVRLLRTIEKDLVLPAAMTHEAIGRRDSTFRSRRGDADDGARGSGRLEDDQARGRAVLTRA